MARHGRYGLVAVLAMVAAVGCAMRFAYRGPGADWASEHGAGALYATFWVLAVCTVFPGVRPATAVIGVSVCVCAVEALQLWHPAWLEDMRATLMGTLLLGGTFDWLDFPHYAAGGALGWLIVRLAGQRCVSSPVDSTHAQR